MLMRKAEEYVSPFAYVWEFRVDWLEIPVSRPHEDNAELCQPDRAAEVRAEKVDRAAEAEDFR